MSKAVTLERMAELAADFTRLWGACGTGKRRHAEAFQDWQTWIGLNGQRPSEELDEKAHCRDDAGKSYQRALLSFVENCEQLEVGARTF